MSYSHNKYSPEEDPRELGWAFPAFLLFVGITTPLLRLALAGTVSTLTLLQDTSGAILERARLLRKIAASPPYERGCHRVDTPHPSHRRTPIGNSRIICTVAPRPYRSIPVISEDGIAFDFDFESLFSRGTHCTGALVPLHFRPAVTAQAAYTCALSSFTAESFIVNENITANQLQVASVSKVAVIASLGSIGVKDRITITGPTVIFAGGDIVISHLGSLDPRRAKVTIISASGSVMLNSIQVGVSPLLLSRRDMRAPPLTLNGPYPLLSENKNARVTGISTRQLEETSNNLTQY